MASWKKRKKYDVEVIETTGEKIERKRIRLTKFLKRELIFTIVSILMVTTLIIGGSYAIFTNIQKAEKYNIVKTGTLQIAYDDTSSGLGNIINLNGAFPESDSEGQKREPYRFKITNTGSLTVQYKVKILDDINMIEEDDCEDNLLEKSKIKYSINGGTPVILDTMKEDYIVITGSLGPSKSAIYEVRMWIDDTAGNEVLGTHYHGKIVVEGIQGEGEPNVPKMDDAMIAVTYSEDQAAWVKASEKGNWYNYEEGRWANAVTVSSITRNSYKKAKVGTVINMDDIETMWVWIPRYSYTIGSMDGTSYYGKQEEYLESTPTKELPGEIDVKFVSPSTKEDGDAQYIVSEGISGWRTPDAFTFGDEELSGIWVGKFETSSSNPSATDGGGNVTTLDAMIKPNVTSWRGIQAANLAEVGRNVTKAGNRYGLGTTLDSHAMKNAEWASVAYLSQSKYGKLGNTAYTGANKEIYQNKSNQYITGCSYGAPSNGSTGCSYGAYGNPNDNSDYSYGCQYTYNALGSGTGASTTGTIYGIYDMSGGSWELLMANNNKYSGKNRELNSGYTGILFDQNTFVGKDWLEDKYYDFYSSNDVVLTCNEKPCYSHGLFEVAEWYENTYLIGGSSYPWMTRGGAFSTGIITTGIFQNNVHSGNGANNISFRLVLSAN